MSDTTETELGLSAGSEGTLNAMHIHKPKAAHSVREFLSEVGVIVVGIAIALAGEQAVETIHRQHERSELRESLQRETDQILRDAPRIEKSMLAEIKWDRQIGDILAAAARSHQPLGPLPPSPVADFDVPDNPIYRAAQTSGKLTLLSKDEREAYSEMDALIGKVSGAYAQREEALGDAIETQNQVAFDQVTRPTVLGDDLHLSSGFAALVGSKISPENLSKLFDETGRVELKVARLVYWSRQTRGAAVALQRGDRELRTIQKAERQFDGPP